MIGLILVGRLPFPTTDTTIRLGLRWSKKEKVNRVLAFIAFCFLVIDTVYPVASSLCFMMSSKEKIMDTISVLEFIFTIHFLMCALFA